MLGDVWPWAGVPGASSAFAEPLPESNFRESLSPTLNLRGCILICGLTMILFLCEHSCLRLKKPYPRITGLQTQNQHCKRSPEPFLFQPFSGKGWNLSHATLGRHNLGNGTLGCDDLVHVTPGRNGFVHVTPGCNDLGHAIIHLGVTILVTLLLGVYIYIYVYIYKYVYIYR